MSKWVVSYPASSPLADYHSVVEGATYDDAMKAVTSVIGGAFSSLYRDNKETREAVAKYFPTEIPLGDSPHLDKGLSRS